MKPFRIDNEARSRGWLDFLDKAAGPMLQCGTHKGLRAREDAVTIDLYDDAADRKMDIMCLAHTGGFGSCCCHAVLEHVENPMAALNEISRVVSAGGFVHLEVPWNQPMHYAEPWGDYHRWTLDGLMIDAKMAGIEYLNGGWFGRSDYAAVWMVGKAE